MKRLLGLMTTLALATAPLYARQADREQDEDDSRAQRAFARLSVSLGGTGYNRVEGLPFLIGPVARSAGPNPFRGRAALIVRTDPVFSLDQVGYDVQGEKLLTRRFVIGAGAYSEVRAIEDRGLSNVDNSLSAFVFHDDYRDYHNRQGVYLYAGYAPRRGPLSAAAEFRTERHDVLGRGNPGSIIKNNNLWRFQPMIAEGKVHSLAVGLEFDNRGRRRVSGRRGWLIRGEITKALGGKDLQFPEVAVTANDPPMRILTIDPSFTIGMIDVRRYTAIKDLSINVRLAAGGTLSDRVLPPQYQHTLGGRGSLPGLNGPAESPGASVPAMDCGARTLTLVSTNLAIGSPRFYPFYGCDRYVLFQAQLEGYFGFRIGPEDFSLGGDPTDLIFELVPRWIAFFNASQAWAFGALGPFPRTDEDRQYDVGGGVAFGDLGFFVAVPLQGDERGAKLVVRLGSRF